MKTLKEDIDNSQQEQEETEEKIKLLKDDIEEVDEKIFNMRKEKADIEQRLKTAEAQEKAVIDVKEETKYSDEKPAPTETEITLKDRKFFKDMLLEALKHKTEELT